MKNILDILSAKLSNAFVEAGYDEKFGKVTISNRPDLCEYQCNGAMAGAKAYKCAPIAIATAVVDILKEDETFSEIVAVNPGFINIKVSDEFVSSYIKKMSEDEHLGVEISNDRMVVIDYGGANVAKPLHVGHLRSAIIGETLKRLFRFKGDKVIGDVHLGDWGLQMGMVIAGIIEQFGLENLMTKEDREKHITISVLEKTYPAITIPI